MTGKAHAAHRDYSKLNIILTVVTVLGNLLVLFTMFNITKFASLGKAAFIFLNVLVLVIQLIVDVIVLSAVRTHKGKSYFLGLILSVLCLAVGAFGTFTVVKVNQSISSITNTTVEESVSTSFVIYDSEDAFSIQDVNGLEGKTVGYAQSTNTGDLGKNQLNALSLNVSLEEYQDYSTLLIALFNGSIDCAILPTNYMNLFQNEAGISSLLEHTKSVLDFEEKVTVVNTGGADKDITKEPFTVLLIGTADGLSDTMILCSVNPISMKVTMSSLARDSYVQMAGGGYSKLNSARAVSVDYLIRTIEKLIGVKIDYYIDTNFQGVVDIVDAVGGITVNSPVSFVGQNASSQRGHYTVYVPAGDNVTLNGEQALAFARERYLFSTGDFARQSHQQEVIKAIVREILRTRDVNTFLNIMQAAGNNIQTNLSVSQMTEFVSYAMRKANRYRVTDHVEDVFEIQTSRVTGYSSGLPDEGLRLVLYIYRLWNGSIAATRNAIERNINMDTPITKDSSRMSWSVNWEFIVPTISYEFYNEPQIGYEEPSWMKEVTCGEHAYADDNGNCVCEGGYEGDAYQGCTAIPVETQETDETVKMENLIGRSKEEATNWLKSNGLGVNYDTVPVTDPSLVGVVARQNYDSGAQVPKGTKVTIFIGVQSTESPEPTDSPEPVHTHSYSGSETSPASCEGTGVMTWTCSCGDSYTETIPALGHDWQVIESADPTCTGPGYAVYQCSRCGASFREDYAQLTEGCGTPEPTGEPDPQPGEGEQG
ncbi:MAG: LCP family protein [Solobacterium sp.]|nr:LCP family protein [Solobacterium sp.]